MQRTKETGFPQHSADAAEDIRRLHCCEEEKPDEESDRWPPLLLQSGMWYVGQNVTSAAVNNVPCAQDETSCL